MRRVIVIGIGTGNPKHLTMQAIGALNGLDAVFIPRKGESKADLAELRREICRRFLTNPATRLVEFDLPVRNPREPAYGKRVTDWHDAIADLYCDLIAAEADDATIGLLVWGDPSLYDSTLRILERVGAKAGFPFAIDVIPGITSLQALAASHAIPLNDIGAPFMVTTGRRLREEGFPTGTDTALVMLDGECSFTALADAARYTIWWGAYLGMENEITVSGPLDCTAEKIVRTRETARARHGWIMDIYLLRRNL
jgi:precorrin-6A synthase